MNAKFYWNRMICRFWKSGSFCFLFCLKFFGWKLSHSQIVNKFLNIIYSVLYKIIEYDHKINFYTNVFRYISLRQKNIEVTNAQQTSPKITNVWQKQACSSENKEFKRTKMDALKQIIANNYRLMIVYDNVSCLLQPKNILFTRKISNLV